MMNFACLNLDHYHFEEKIGKKPLSKTTINISGDNSGNSFSHVDHNRSLSPKRIGLNRTTSGIEDLKKRKSTASAGEQIPKFIFKKDL